MIPCWLLGGRRLSGSQQAVQLVLWAARCARQGYAKRSKPSLEDIDTRLLPTVSIVGRPNVGKSALFNRLIGKRDALVYDTPRGHVTRDYKEGVGQLGDLSFLVVDTSGLEPMMPAQSLQARATALTAGVLKRTDIALFLLDAKEGVLPADHSLARWLQRTLGPHQHLVLGANKAETRDAQRSMVETVAEASRLGLGQPVAFSATSGEGLVDLYQALQPLVDAHVAQARERLGLAEGEDGSSGGRDAGAEEALLRRWRESRIGEGRWQQEQPAVGGTSQAAGVSGPGGLAPGAVAAAEQRSNGAAVAGIAGDSKGGAHGPAQAEAAKDGQLQGQELQGALMQDARQEQDGCEEQEEQEEWEEGWDEGHEEYGEGYSSDEGGGEGVADEGGSKEGEAQPAVPPAPLRLALMGLPNAGKSTLMNRLLGMERSLTGPEPGLTRDAIHAPMAWKGVPVELTDTAGWMKKARLDQFDDVGGGVAAMTLAQGRRALAAVQVVALLLDAERLTELRQVITHKELDLAGTALREGKALVVALNKIDTLSPKQRSAVLEGLRAALSTRFLAAGQLPVVGTSAMKGEGVAELMDAVVGSYNKWNTKIPTSRLIRLLKKLQVRLLGGGPAAAVVARIKFMAQAKARPPTFVAWMRGTKAVDDASERFLGNALRQALGLEGVPIRIHFRYNTKESRGQQERSRARKTMLLQEWVGDGDDPAAQLPRTTFSTNVEQFLKEDDNFQEQPQQQLEQQPKQQYSQAGQRAQQQHMTRQRSPVPKQVRPAAPDKRGRQNSRGSNDRESSSRRSSSRGAASKSAGSRSVARGARPGRGAAGR